MKRARRPFVPEPLEPRRLPASGAPFAVAQELAAGDSFRTAVDFRGRVTVAWESTGAGGDRDVLARRYDAAGVPLGDAFRLDDAPGDQESPRVAVDDAGATTVAWWGGSQLFFRRYDPEGSPIGGPQALAGTAGLGPEFDLVGLGAGGFAVYADGFQLRWYGADGTPGASVSLAGVVAQEGWTLRESDAPDRAMGVDPTGQVVLVWSATRAREEAGATVYDAQIRTLVVGADGVPRASYLLLDASGVAESQALGLEPRLLPESGVVAWFDRAPGGSQVLVRPYSGGDGSVLRYNPGPGAGPSDGEPTAIASPWSGGIWVHYVRPGETGDGASYLRSWSSYKPLPWSQDVLWRGDAATTPTPDLPAGSFGTLAIVPTSGGDFWELWTDPGASPGLHARRFYASTTTVAFAGGNLKVGEEDVALVATIVRTGDLSRPTPVRVFTQPGGGAAALPGYDYTPISVDLVFAPGQVELQVVVPILDDDAPDGDRSFSLGVGAPGGPYVPDSLNRRLVEIVDDDDPARFRLSFFNYGPAGLWTYNPAEGWRKLIDLGPEQVVVGPGRSAFLDYGPYGLWTWDGVRGWRKLNDLGPEEMTVGGGRVYLDYGVHGLWSWSEGGGWAKLNDVDPARMAAGSDAAYLLVEFTRGGLWFLDTDGTYHAVSSDSPEQMAVLGWNALLDFGPSGLWNWNLFHGWRKVGDFDARALVASGSSVYVDMGPSGLAFQYNYPLDGAPTFSRLNETAPASIAPASGAGDGGSYASAFASFGPAGLWRWDVIAGWSKLNDLSPQAVYATPGGADAVLDYGPQGVWRWDPTTGWSKINDASPLAVARM